MQLENLVVLVLRPLGLIYIGRKVVVPPLATLLADASREKLRNLSPVSSAKNADFLSQDRILVLSPRALRHEVRLIRQL